MNLRYYLPITYPLGNSFLICQMKLIILMTQGWIKINEWMNILKILSVQFYVSIYLAWEILIVEQILNQFLI